MEQFIFVINFFSISLTSSKMTWSNIPLYKTTVRNVTRNTERVLCVEDEIYWENMTISFDLEIVWGTQRLTGKVK